MQAISTVRPSSHGLVLMCLGALVFLGAASLLAVLSLASKAPTREALVQVSGRVKSVEIAGVPRGERELRIVVDQAGTDYDLRLRDVDKLPLLDWPAESVVAGDRVVAWYTQDAKGGNSGTLWQLHRGRQRIAERDDTAALASDRARSALPWGAFGLVAGATLFAAGRIRRKRATATP